MVLQLYEEVPAVCENKKCADYKSFELVDVNDIKRDPLTKEEYVLCPTCGERIIFND